MPIVSVGALLALLGVAAGAFGAHALRDRLEPAQLQVFETAVRYQLVHALALLFVGAHARSAPRRGAGPAAAMFVAGILVFSGSLYALALSGLRGWGAVTPLGGLCLMGGWVAVARAWRPARGER